METGLSQANRLFISYAHADNDLFGDAVRAFAESLRGFYAAKTGNDLSVFFDRESIGWGDDWRSQIDGELENASIFMPVITMQYFNRPACRDELNAFNQSAKRLGAQYLILPVVIAGASFIRTDHPIPEVATIEALQYRNLEEAFLAGQGTAEWRRALSALTDELISLISRAEQAAPALPQRGQHDADANDPLDDDGDSDFLSDMAEMDQLTSVMTREVEQVQADLQVWSDVVKENASRIKPGLTAQQMRAASIVVANELKGPSQGLHDSGVQFAETVEKADAVMNSFKEHISRLPDQEQRDSLRGLVIPVQDSTDLRNVVSNMAGLLDSMASVEVMSAPLRKSLKPARIGITKIQDAVRIVDRWLSDI
ncbi:MULTISPECIES: toll/interleukin-1 receptor domain-containing protein [unclassified Streptomyces]|uniref:toll/interleukin-1 receptor domain-containing protein n=1 Tax=unclassified Streptomyces TaxID=2593676 RepID=UPI0029A202DA|nr:MULTISPECIES: toll/interleukin-1 receptor domain-containing protein [unclassified Streptomyces]MDX3368495.1 toll/interleukin-1 receptor domain-containing protein [Streptomyces sp. ME02-6987-2C]MDX3425338.1 toll/interleukin-1 receptor domain-containing protein [Streptomyces sp. ME02-6985-2c]